MSLMDKFKGLFTEPADEEEEPIKKEVFQVEIPAPKIEEKHEVEEKVEIKEEKREDKFVFPVFDESDFDEDIPKHVAPSTPIVEPKRPMQQPLKKPEPKKVFKPSPVISPVYGILDKNYKKEDIVPKKIVNQERYFNFSEDAASLDAVRKKAFGTLEDELETNLDQNEISKYEEENQVVIPKEFDETKKEEIKEEKNDMDESLEDMFFSKDMTLEDAVNKYEESQEKEAQDDKDDLIESDLFNLIDSMYDKEDE